MLVKPVRQAESSFVVQYLAHYISIRRSPFHTHSAYSTILKGAEPKTKLEHQPSNSASLPKRHSTNQLGTRANQTYACYTRGLSNGDASRAAFKDMYCAEDFQVYLRALGRLKGLEGTEWPNYAAISLPKLADSAKSRNKEQERQLLQALRSYRKPEEVQIYLDAITPESGLTQRTNTLNDKLQRDIVDAERLENQRAAQVARLAEKKASDLVEQNAQMQQRMKAQQLLKEKVAQEQKNRSAQAMVEQLLKEEAEKARRYSRQLQDQKAELAKEGIETRRRLAPRRIVSESESFLISRLIVEERTAEASEEFFRWANAKMNNKEKEEYNRMLWIMKGQDAKDKMLVIPGGSEMRYLLS